MGECLLPSLVFTCNTIYHPPKVANDWKELCEAVQQKRPICKVLETRLAKSLQRSGVECEAMPLCGICGNTWMLRFEFSMNEDVITMVKQPTDADGDSVHDEKKELRQLAVIGTCMEAVLHHEMVEDCVSYHVRWDVRSNIDSGRYAKQTKTAFASLN